jgi:hypothetical protein
MEASCEAREPVPVLEDVPEPDMLASSDVRVPVPLMLASAVPKSWAL